MWLLIISAIAFPLSVLLMPKRISRIELYATTGMAVYLQLITDVYLHIKLNWYGYLNQEPRVEWATVFLTPIYISINPLFLNFYPYKNAKLAFFYIAGWSVFSTFYEWLAVKTGIFYHNDWRLWHSAITYPFLFILLRLQLGLVRRMIKRD
ncbi:hypothetical protein [Peribacillus sp. SCS-155]|uniref:hypothetical protein n=1 Tax=Peribacillus sedimenti TaxID=3115297 RepID=UPI003905D0B8